MNKVECAIEEIVNAFVTEEGYISYDGEDENNNIFNVIANCLEADFDVEYSIETDCLHLDKYHAIGYIAISWYDEDGLHLQTYAVERRNNE